MTPRENGPKTIHPPQGKQRSRGRSGISVAVSPASASASTSTVSQPVSEAALHSSHPAACTYFLSRAHKLVWEWITERSPDAAGVRPVPGKETFGYACSLFEGRNGRYLTIVGEENKIERPRYRDYKRPKRITKEGERVARPRMGPDSE
jgi:hypothetical protein